MNDLKREPTRLGYIDALRGYAFLLVLASHTEFVVGYFGDHYWTDYTGQYGVQLFFILSALALCKSMTVRGNADRFPLLYFYLRRLFRIAPLFWFAMAFYWSIRHILPSLWLDKWAPPGGVDWTYFVMTALFLNGWTPYMLNSIVPGAWSIAVEMNFCMIFPALFSSLNRLERIVVAFLIMVSVMGIGAGVTYHYLVDYYLSQPILPYFVIHCFPAQLSVFFLGMMLHRLQPERFAAPANLVWAQCLLWFSVATFISLTLAGSFYLQIGVFNALALAGVVLAFSFGDFPLLNNRLIRYLGKISYSCYLTHFFALTVVLRLFGVVQTKEQPVFHASSQMGNLGYFFVVASIGLVLTCLLSTITYYLIEKPGIAFGKKVIQHIEHKFAAAAA